MGLPYPWPPAFPQPICDLTSSLLGLNFSRKFSTPINDAERRELAQGRVETGAEIGLEGNEGGGDGGKRIHSIEVINRRETGEVRLISRWNQNVNGKLL